MKKLITLPQNNNKKAFIQYDNDVVFVLTKGKETLELHFDYQGETIWATQGTIAELFSTTKQNISKHIKNIYETKELLELATVNKKLTVQKEGGRSIQRELDFYNLDMIISVGYRVNSETATRFRQWATARLNEFIIKGFTMDDNRLKKNGGSTLPYMGLTSFKDKYLIQSDAYIAKNYLNEEELKSLNLLVDSYLSFAEIQASRKVAMHMTDWVKKLDEYLKFASYEVLGHAGNISHEKALEKAEDEYEKYRIKQDKSYISDFDEVVLRSSKGIKVRKLKNK